MIIKPYEQWREERASELERQSEHDGSECDGLECGVCDGDGELYGNGKWYECPACEGAGWIEAEEKEDGPLSRDSYFAECIADIRKWCAWTSRDFLQEAGHFVRSERCPWLKQEAEAAA